MVMNSTSAVATIIQAVSPELISPSAAMRDSTGNKVAANTNSTLVRVPNNDFFFMLIKKVLAAQQTIRAKQHKLTRP